MTPIETPQLNTPVAAIANGMPPLPPLTPRQAVLHKLTDRLEAGFSRHVTAADKLALFSSKAYLPVIVSKHFRFAHQVAEDLVKSSATVAELASRISDLQDLPAENLF